MANFSTSPLAQDEYSRLQAAVFDERQIISVPTVFQSIFGRMDAGSRTLFSPDSVVVDIDIIRGNERLAALTHRGKKGRDIGTAQADTIQQQYSNFSRVYPLIEEVGNIESDQLLFRLPGELPNSPGVTQFDRLRAHAAEIHQEHIRRMLRLQEVLASQSARTGIMDAILGTSDTDLQYDFLRPAGHTFTPAPVWTNPASDPLADIDTGCALIRNLGHATADYALFGQDVMDAFVNHAGVQALADNRRFQLIDVSSNPVPDKLQWLVDAGALPRGRVQTPGGNNIWIFTYLDVYTVGAAPGTPTRYMPDDEVFLSSSSARADRYFGPPERLPSTLQDNAVYQELFGFAPGMQPMPPLVKNPGATVLAPSFYFDAYRSEDRKRVSLRTQAAPIFATTQTDAFVRMDGVA